MRRPRPLVLVLVLVAFVAVSVGLARFLTAESRERDALVDVLTAQAAGDPGAMLDAMDPSCRRAPACVAQVRRNARAQRLPGEVKIINVQSQTAYALGAATGTTRVVWAVVDRGLPTVQCVEIRRKGSALAGRSISVLRVSAPIDRESSCP
ncbi:hypothetical protein GKE82_20260 [Conexibacter sp. W3-3-2]|uniref:hypothetical protein n=1 Tax=Conexibacter sp. W3-3-2 TaxID=2675227 RepID=UPI0012B90E7E|nr:hypothetical protein [Conexibacter sp. W3-3-2]MTD46557.1 hypothetical protein [Conexibacter sp. W3-3-2]